MGRPADPRFVPRPGGDDAGAGRQQLQLPRPPAGQPREAHPQLLPVPHRILHHAGQAWEGHTDLPHAVAAEQPESGAAPFAEQTDQNVLGANVVIAKLFGFSVIRLMRIFKDELVLAYSTASSETVLPRVIEKMEAYGCPKAICSFVVPTGYSFNLDGSTLYQSIAAIFIAQLYGIDLSISQQLLLVLTLMVTSKGIAGVPGVSFVVLLATLGSVGIPLEGLAFIAGVDRVMDMARTALNVIGNALAVLVISRWEGMYDDAKGQRYWNSLPHWRSKQALPKGE